MSFNASDLSLTIVKNFVPNYPAADPIFYIPKVPEFVPVHEPLPPKKPPPPGYDLKTLRKQVEYLNEEINERQQNTRAMVMQNGQLWDYVQDLLEANKFNAAKMREKVKQLNEELRVAQKERYQLLQKLDLARNSKKMMEELSKELEEAQVTVEEMQRRKREAEQSLNQANLERENLEESLHEQLERMHSYEDLLTQYENKKMEEDAIDRAEEYFFSNKATLKAAYLRFRQGVMRRTRENHLHETLTRVRKQVTLHEVWILWKGFLNRKLFMKNSQVRRRLECLSLYHKKWKLHTALEKLCRQSQRKQLLSHCYSQWKAHTAELRYEKWANNRIQEHKLVVFKRKFFTAWKSTVMFLEWCSDDIYRRERQAMFFFHKKLFSAWKKVSHRGVVKFYGFAVVVAHNVKKYRFKAWYAQCKRRWTWRGRLLRRFFSNIRSSLARRHQGIVNAKYALQHHVGYKKYHAMGNWRQYVRKQSNRQVVDPHHMTSHQHSLVKQKTISIESHYMKRAMKTSLYSFVYSVSVMQRQTLGKRVAMQHYLSRIASLFIAKWRHFSYCKKNRRERQVKLSHERVFQKLIGIVEQAHYVSFIKEGLAFIQTTMEKRILRDHFEAFIKVYVKERRARVLGEYLLRQVVRKVLSQSFYTWSNKWMSKVYWELKELKIDQARLQSIQQLHETELREYAEERNELEEENRMLEKNIESLKEMIEEKDVENFKKEEEIVSYQKLQEEYQKEVDELIIKVKDREEELKRWQSLEQTLEQERLFHEQERERRRKESEEQLLRMKEESAQLQQRYQHISLANIETLQLKVQQAEEELKAAEDEDDALRSELREYRSMKETLDFEEEKMSSELSRIQSKLSDVMKEGDSLRYENEKMLRHRLAELKVLESDAGVAQARVMTMYDLLDEQNAVDSRMKIQEVAQNTQKEMSEIIEKRVTLEKEMLAMRDKFMTGSSSTFLQTISLYESNPPMRESTVQLDSESEESYLPLAAGTGTSSLLPAQALSPLPPRPPGTGRASSHPRSHRYQNTSSAPPTPQRSLQSLFNAATSLQPSPKIERDREEKKVPGTSPPISSATLSPEQEESVGSVGEKNYEDAQEAIRNLTERLKTRLADVL